MKAWACGALVFLVATGAVADEWGLGLRATGEHFGHGSDDQGGIDMGGGALILRWRMSPLFGLELGLGGSDGKQAGGAFERKTGALDLTAMFHLSPGSRWDFYLLAGVGAVSDTVNFIDVDGVSVEQKFKETEGRLGVGLEYRLRHFGFGAEAAAVGRVRNDRDAALEADAVPGDSGGARVSLTVGYYF